MTVRALHLLGSPVLRQKAEPVARVDDAIRRFVDDLSSWTSVRITRRRSS